MKNLNIKYRPIGLIHSPYVDTAPYQSVDDSKNQFYIDVFPEYEEGLAGVEKFKYLIILYHLDQIEETNKLTVEVSWADGFKTGLFSTRSPNRLNPIGYSVVKFIKREGHRLYITGIDAFDGTPVLDIKPYLLDLDSKSDADNGWLDDLEDKEHLFLHLKGIPH